MKNTEIRSQQLTINVEPTSRRISVTSHNVITIFNDVGVSLSITYRHVPHTNRAINNDKFVAGTNNGNTGRTMTTTHVNTYARVVNTINHSTFNTSLITKLRSTNISYSFMIRHSSIRAKATAVVHYRKSGHVILSPNTGRTLTNRSITHTLEHLITSRLSDSTDRVTPTTKDIFVTRNRYSLTTATRTLIYTRRLKFCAIFGPTPTYRLPTRT